jgi:prophage maintenance system killer protein
LKRTTPFLTPFLLVFLLFNTFVFAQKPDDVKALEAKLTTTKIDTAKLIYFIKLLKLIEALILFFLIPI